MIAAAVADGFSFNRTRRNQNGSETIARGAQMLRPGKKEPGGTIAQV
jgi:hypothetical protein